MLHGRRKFQQAGDKTVPPLRGGYRVVQIGASRWAQPATREPLHRRVLGCTEPWGQCQPRAELGATLLTFGGHTGRSYSTALLCCDPRNVKPKNREAWRWHTEYFEQYWASDSDIPSCFFSQMLGERGSSSAMSYNPKASSTRGAIRDEQHSLALGVLTDRVILESATSPHS